MISANAGLNGKLIVNLEKVEGVNVFIFLQPNNFNKELSVTHGILENNMLYSITVYVNQETKKKYMVPTDWTIIISYNYDKKKAGDL